MPRLAQMPRIVCSTVALQSVYVAPVGLSEEDQTPTHTIFGCEGALLNKSKSLLYVSASAAVPNDPVRVRRVE